MTQFSENEIFSVTNSLLFFGKKKNSPKMKDKTFFFFLRKGFATIYAYWLPVFLRIPSNMVVVVCSLFSLFSFFLGEKSS
jgi:hypothetical protein